MTVMIDNQPFRVIGVYAKQGTFLGLFSFDTQVVVPLAAFEKSFSQSDVAEALFPNENPIDKTVMIDNQPFRVIGVYAKQGTFLGLFSFDTQVVVPLAAFEKSFSQRLGTEIRVK